MNERPWTDQGHCGVVEALLLLLISLAVLLLRRIVRRAYSRSYRLPPLEVDLQAIDASQEIREDGRND